MNRLETVSVANIIRERKQVVFSALVLDHLFVFDLTSPHTQTESQIIYLSLYVSDSR